MQGAGPIRDITVLSKARRSVPKRVRAETWPSLVKIGTLPVHCWAWFGHCRAQVIFGSKPLSKYGCHKETLGEGPAYPGLCPREDRWRLNPKRSLLSRTTTLVGAVYGCVRPVANKNEQRRTKVKFAQAV
ncbi:hypothetical protein Droror1_Dr00027173 [Drosera rotundifolia]